jgi:hypothetical protein
MKKILACCVALSGVWNLSAAEVWIYGKPSPETAAIAGSLERRKLSSAVGEAGALADCRLLLIAPGTVCPEALRNELPKFMAAGGAVIATDPVNFGRIGSGCADKELIEDWNPEKPSVKIGGSSKGLSLFFTAEDGRRFVNLSVPYFRSGSVYVSAEGLQGKIRSDAGTLIFNAMGGKDSDLLTVNITDADRRQWVSYHGLTGKPEDVAIRFADFLPLPAKAFANFDFGGKVDEKADPLKGDKVEPGKTFSDEKLRPEKIAAISIGLSRRHLWWDKGGAVRVGPVFAAADPGDHGLRSGYPARFDIPYSIIGVTVPPSACDPFDGTKAFDQVTVTATDWAQKELKFDGKAVELPRMYAVPPRPAAHGREVNDKNFVDFVRRRADRRIALLATADGVSAAELILPCDEKNTSGVFGAIGLPASSYVPDGLGPETAAGMAEYLLGNVQILDVIPNVIDDKLTARVILKNPGKKEISGRVTVKVKDLAEAGAAVQLPAGGTRSVSVVLPEIPEDFDFAGFDWSVTFDGEGQKDSLSDQANVRRSVEYIVRRMLELSETHADGRFTHHHFVDTYGARAFMILGEKEHRPELTAAARRLVDGIVSRQGVEGGFPMGYGEEKRIFWVADNGTAALVILDFAAHVPELREKYLAAVKKYYQWRETFYQSPEKVVELRKKYGENSPYIRVGFYGIGYNDSLFYNSTGKLRETIRIPLGENWVTGISMASLPMYYQLTGDREVLEIARRNFREYLPTVTKMNYFAVESVYQFVRYLPDDDIAEAGTKAIKEKYIDTLTKEDDYIAFDKGARRTMDMLGALYYYHTIEKVPALRAFMVKNIWLHCSGTSPQSVFQVGGSFRHSTHGSSIAAARYAGPMGLCWLVEVLYPQSTLLPAEKCVDFPKRHQDRK